MFLVVLFICTVAAFAVSAVSGGGAGLVLMPVLRMGLGMEQVPVALSLGSAASSIARIGAFCRHIEWRIVRWFVPCSLPGALMGAWLLQYVSPAYAQWMVGLFLVANFPMLWRNRSVALRSVLRHGRCWFASGYWRERFPDLRARLVCCSTASTFATACRKSTWWPRARPTRSHCMV